jgi:glycosyltransferase involved in cell wall biosynthesis
MAAKNYARFLPAAVESVLAQTVADWELVVIDDGSTDATPAAVEPYRRDPRVRYVRSDRLGQSRAKNLGIRLSRGEVIAFLDADDVWRPTKLEKQLALMESGRAGVVFSLRELIDEDGNPITKPLAGPPPYDPAAPLDALFVQNFVCFSSAVVRREVFDRVGGFDPNLDLAIDYDLWLRAAPHYRFAHVAESLVLYRTGHGNLSQKLADRVATAFSIMHRCVHRRHAPVGRRAVAVGYGSTARALGWVYRRSEPLEAVRWFARSLPWAGGRAEAVKGIVASGLHWVRRTRGPTAAENRTENL